MIAGNNTIRRSIFIPYAVMVFVMVSVIAVVFNLVFQASIRRDINSQLLELSAIAESIALNEGPDYLPDYPHPPMVTSQTPEGAASASPESPSQPAGDPNSQPPQDSSALRFSFYLDHALRGEITLFNAHYLLIGSDDLVLAPAGADFFSDMTQITDAIRAEIRTIDKSANVATRNLTWNGASYRVAFRHLNPENHIGLEWVIIFTDNSRVKSIQTRINLILLLVLFLSAGLTTWLSSRVARSIARPFTEIRQQVSDISEMRFPPPLVPSSTGTGEIRDLTEAVNLLSERMQQHNQAQMNVLQNVSHEFRTPLMSIRSYAEGIQHAVVTVQEAVPVILSETARLTRLVEDLLYLSRLDLGNGELITEDVVLSEWIPDVIQRIRLLAENAGKRILHPSAIPDVSFRCNRDQMTRALINVLSNSVSFASTTVRVLLSVTGTDVHILVEDDGPGFREEDIPHLFERFYKGRKDGIGLGLSISKSILSVHHGKIIVENSGRGAVIHLIFPLDPRNGQEVT